jgi:hypothetical protein
MVASEEAGLFRIFPLQVALSGRHPWWWERVECDEVKMLGTKVYIHHDALTPTISDPASGSETARRGAKLNAYRMDIEAQGYHLPSFTIKRLPTLGVRRRRTRINSRSYIVAIEKDITARFRTSDLIV